MLLKFITTLRLCIDFKSKNVYGLCDCLFFLQLEEFCKHSVVIKFQILISLSGFVHFVRITCGRTNRLMLETKGRPGRKLKSTKSSETVALCCCLHRNDSSHQTLTLLHAVDV